MLHVAGYMIKMKKILLSVSIIAAVAAIAFGVTTAFFSDTETSTGNTFTAGALDLKVDSDCHYYQNNVDIGCTGFGNWKSTDLTAEKFFNFTDIKPGDSGEDTVSLTVDNDACLKLVIGNLVDNEGSPVACTEPETVAEGKGCYGEGDCSLMGNEENCEDYDDCVWQNNCPHATGELRSQLLFSIFTDADCDNIKEEGDVELISAGPVDAGGETWVLPGHLTGGAAPTCFGIAWELPSTVGNDAQTDVFGADMTFNVIQYRNNTGCVWPTP